MDRKIPTPGSHYKHYKGNTYTVMFISTCTDKQVQLITYFNPDKPEQLWTRNLAEFMSSVLVDTKVVYRFDLIL